MEKQFGLSDQVIARIAQIVQEGMLLGVDVVDLLRQVRVTAELTDDSVETGQLILTNEYRRQVRSMHEQLVAEAERLQAEGGDQEAEENSSFLVKE
jgi:hypothetical protein